VSESPVALSLAPLLGSAHQPLLFGLLLALAVGVGLPAGTLVVGAGALLGPWIGLVTVLLAQAAGLTLNWRLCRGVLRPRMQRWLEERRRGRRLRRLLQQPAELRLLVLLRLAAIPMALVNAACALGPTPLRPYVLASLVLVPRFSLMVLAGSLGAEAVRGSLSPLALAARIVAVLATAAVLLLLARGLRRGLPPCQRGP
jgi:uncharacterized membrane protein YdjX (TVP38/TMEM64 family)